MKEILVMDCEERETFWLTLTSDYKILFAPTAERGMNMLSGNIGIVFLGLGLPDTEGIEALELIRREYPSKAVIIIDPCGKEEACMCMEAFRKGAWDYIKKPLKADEILRKIKTFMDMKDVSQELHETLSATETPRNEQYPNIPSHLVDGVLRVKNFIAQNYSESLTLAAACKMAATSKTYFCRFFKDITGHSLRSYQHVVKIRRAEELLRDKRLSVTDIALTLGYTDSNYFSTIYKKITGTSPKYRRTAFGNVNRVKTFKHKLGETLEHIEP